MIHRIVQESEQSFLHLFLRIITLDIEHFLEASSLYIQCGIGAHMAIS